MIELIVAGFDDTHTAFLVGATLSRMQKDLSVDRHDVIVLSREESGRITVREDIDLNDEKRRPESFWNTLARMLFSRPSPVDELNADSVTASLVGIGIDEAFRAKLQETVRLGMSAIFILVNEISRDKVLGILRGFRGKTLRTHLIGEDRNEWLTHLTGE